MEPQTLTAKVNTPTDGAELSRSPNGFLIVAPHSGWNAQDAQEWVELGAGPQGRKGVIVDLNGLQLLDRDAVVGVFDSLGVSRDLNAVYVSNRSDPRSDDHRVYTQVYDMVSNLEKADRVLGCK